MGNLAFQRLLYKGNFSLRRKIDYGEAILSARYPGGYREDAVIGRPLRSWRLNYPALMLDTYVELPSGEQILRLDYVWGFYCASKDAGNLPFIVTDTYDRKDYLAIFPKNDLEITMMDYELSTTGLEVEQIFVKGVQFLDDGSLGEFSNNAQV